MTELSDPVTIGIVVGPHGVRGTARVRPSGMGRHLREGVEPVLAGLRRRISHVRETPKGFLVDLQGIEDRSGIRALQGEALLLERAELDDPEADEVYVGDLVGLTAVDEAGEGLGEVVETFDNGAQEVLVVRGPEGDHAYVPFTMEHIPYLDLAFRTITVLIPEED